ncbi:MAG: deoxyguanosinetriphosphate triphosphohydrolase [Firmicutes bacterium]|nr:deoxyguanosinetriphosphate triphosphohydrolase [Bacillota bacterium]
MEIRKEVEQREKTNLSPYACLSMYSKGRLYEEPQCDIRTDFQRDRDRILHSKAFRRLKHKTQVFIAPEGDHYRTRLTHTLEVAQIARTIARALNLNEDLTEAIALGHDLGHTPFGHAGEVCLNQLAPGGFKHNEQSLRVVDILEQGKGLNLTLEVRDGILKHTGDEKPMTLEGQIVKIADRIAYINHDIDDALRAGILQEKDLPVAEISRLGSNSSQRLNTMIRDIIVNSRNCPNIIISEEMQQILTNLRKFMFQTVYVDSAAKSEEAKVKHVITAIYEYLLQNPDRLPPDLRSIEKDVERVVCDYIAGMTDRFIINLYQYIFIPKPWQN